MAWTNYTCIISDNESLVLIDERFENQAPVEQLPGLTWIGVWCNEHSEHKFWSPKEEDKLDEIEDDLIRLADEHGNGWAVYVMRIASHGIREYYIYHATSVELSSIASTLKSIYPKYRIEMEATHDPKWQQYRKYVSFNPAA